MDDKGAVRDMGKCQGKSERDKALCSKKHSGRCFGE